MANRAHLIGIGGEGMSALAKVLQARGWRVSGSDLVQGPRTAELERLGIEVMIGHQEENLSAEAEVVIFSSAVPQENIELAAARRHGLAILPRLEMVRLLLREREALGVAGTHGKSTTAAMLAFLLERAGLAPSFILGAPCPALGGNARWASGRHMVAEIDESDGYFIEIGLDLAVITNIGVDHLNNYSSAEALYRAFRRFASNSRCLILNGDDGPSRRLLAELGKGPEVLIFGLGEGEGVDLRAVKIHHQGFETAFKLVFRGEEVGEVLLPAPGRHNVYNALAAVLAGWASGLGFTGMAEALRRFTLPERRFQVLHRDGVVVVDDYAHLPEQIEANLGAIRAGWRPGPKRLIALFQPHRFSRMEALHSRFLHSFDSADRLIVTEIYPACESPIPGVEALSLVRAIRKRGKKVDYIPDKEEILQFLRRELRPGDFLISFGAGDLWEVSHRLVSSLKLGG
ncbi:TPA: UDP-N-acetylmuramate--L-alanine ligase [Candidatus Bipolaricaulota bacterium]|nr:UDP-N-acetylmuramate--L-alanine ligase [Candidatus Bipolaricaulota bacterium]